MAEDDFTNLHLRPTVKMNPMYCNIGHHDVDVDDNDDDGDDEDDNDDDHEQIGFDISSHPRPLIFRECWKWAVNENIWSESETFGPNKIAG